MIEEPGFVVLVPWRGGDSRREWLWDLTRPYLEALGPVFTGDSEGPWARAAACNAASVKAKDWKVALIADTDTVIEEPTIRRAVAWVKDTGAAVRPHLDRFLLTKQGTDRFAQRGLSELRKEDWSHTWPGGGLLVITREAWDAVGGYDAEHYEGWFGEDTDLNLRLLRAVGWDRLPGRAWHLFHPLSRARPENRRHYQEMLAEHASDIAWWLENQRGLTLGKETL